MISTTFPWTAAATALELPWTSEALPANTTCPLCHGDHLRVYADRTGDNWCYCVDCAWAGSLLELASKVWQIPVEAAATRLAQAGAAPVRSPDEVAKLLRTGIAGARSRFAALWERARGQLPTRDSNCLMVLRDLRLLTTGADHKSAFHPIQMIGSTGTRELTEVLGITKRTCFTAFGSMRDRPLVLMPYWDAPGRLCGFALRGRFGKTVRTLGDHPNDEAGLAMLPAALAPRNPFGQYVFAMEDPWVALRLHVRHVHTSTRPLPLISWRSDSRGRTRMAWQSLERRVPVVWHWQMTARALQQAILCDGHLGLAGPVTINATEIRNYLRIVPPRDVLNRVLRASAPWPDALAKWMDAVEDGAVTQLLIDLERIGFDRWSIADRLAGKHYARWQSLILPELEQRKISLGGRWLIMECPTGWYIVHNDGPQLLSEVIIRIDTIYRKDGVPHYKGRLLYKGNTVPFDTAVEAIENSPRNWARLKIVAATNERPYISGSWATRLLDMAIKFQAPNVEPC